MIDSSAIILSGGRSSRMKRNKAFVAIEKASLIEELVVKMNQVFKEVIIVTKDPNTYTFLDAKVISDIIPCSSPLSGIHAGLKTAVYEYSFVVACDMPFVDLKLAEYLVSLASGYDVVVPKVGDHYEPLYAVYAKSCLPYIEDCLQKRIYKVIDFFPMAKTYVVAEEKIQYYTDLHKVFFNVNTPQDLEMAKRMS